MFGDLNMFSVLACCLQRTSWLKYFPTNIQYKFGEKEHLKQKYFCDILSISKKCGRRRFSAKVPSTWVFRRKIKLVQEIPSTYSDYGIQSFRIHGRFVPRRFVPRLRCFVPTFGRFVPNPLVDSVPKKLWHKLFYKKHKHLFHLSY